MKKKIVAILAVLVMCVNMIACSSVDTQPAIDSYNQLVDNYNIFVDYANENIDELDQEDVDFLNELTASINEYGAKFDANAEFTQEEVDEMIAMFDELNDVIVQTLDTIE